MECKGDKILKTSENETSIDLTRMECKGQRSDLRMCQEAGIDLTRMECKGYSMYIIKYKDYLYRFNQNGM